MGDDVYPFLTASRVRPAQYTDGTRIAERSTQYGEVMVAPTLPWRQVLAQEGSYHIFHNATNDAATTLAGHAAPVLVDADATMTKPFLFMRNLLNTGKRICLDWIEITVVTAGAAGTTASWAAQLDSGATRFSSGGTALTVVAPDGQITSSLDSTALTILGGAVVVGAENSGTSRDLGFSDLRPTIEVAGDKKIFDFVGDFAAPPAAAAAAVRTDVVRMPPVSLGYTDQFLLAMYAPSQSSAGVYKIRGGMWVR